MISRSIFRSLPFRNAIAHSTNTSPFLRQLSITQCKPPTWSYPSLNPTFARSYQRRREKYYRFDPNEIRNARPLLTNDQIKNFSKHPGLHSFIAILGAGGIFIYVSNLEDVPVSGRRRFNIYSHEAMEREGQMMYEQILRQYQRAILPDWDTRTQMVQRVMSRLIPASGLQNVNWEVNVIDSPGVYKY